MSKSASTYSTRPGSPSSSSAPASDVAMSRGTRWKPPGPGRYPSSFFAPEPSHRRANIHVRVDGTAGARGSLLFRDFLRATPAMRDAWADFKLSVVRVVPQVTLAAYGQIKQPAWLVLMHAADGWAESTGWSPAALSPLPTPLAMDERSPR